MKDKVIVYGSIVGISCGLILAWIDFKYLKPAWEQLLIEEYQQEEIKVISIAEQINLESEFEEWYLKHHVQKKDLDKVIREGEEVYFYTTTIIIYRQWLQIKGLLDEKDGKR